MTFRHLIRPALRPRCLAAKPRRLAALSISLGGTLATYSTYPPQSRF